MEETHSQKRFASHSWKRLRAHRGPSVTHLTAISTTVCCRKGPQVDDLGQNLGKGHAAPQYPVAHDRGGCCKNETKPFSRFVNIRFTQISAVDYCYEISTQTIGLKTRLNKGFHWQHCFIVDIIRWMVLWVTQAYDQFVERGVEFPRCFCPPCFPNEWLRFLNSAYWSSFVSKYATSFGSYW